MYGPFLKRKVEKPRSELEGRTSIGRRIEGYRPVGLVVFMERLELRTAKPLWKGLKGGVFEGKGEDGWAKGQLG